MGEIIFQGHEEGPNYDNEKMYRKRTRKEEKTQASIFRMRN